MSEQRAKEFVQWLANHPDKRAELLSARVGQRRQIMEQNGFVDVDARAIDQVLQSDTAHDLSDEQLQSIQGGLRVAAITWE
jgi:hypothetical protein